MLLNVPLFYVYLLYTHSAQASSPNYDNGEEETTRITGSRASLSHDESFISSIGASRPERLSLGQDPSFTEFTLPQSTAFFTSLSTVSLQHDASYISTAHNSSSHNSSHSSRGIREGRPSISVYSDVQGPQQSPSQSSPLEAGVNKADDEPEPQTPKSSPSVTRMGSAEEPSPVDFRTSSPRQLPLVPHSLTYNHPTLRKIGSMSPPPIPDRFLRHQHSSTRKESKYSSSSPLGLAKSRTRRSPPGTPRLHKRTSSLSPSSSGKSRTYFHTHKRQVTALPSTFRSISPSSLSRMGAPDSPMQFDSAKFLSFRVIEPKVTDRRQRVQDFDSTLNSTLDTGREAIVVMSPYYYVMVMGDGKIMTWRVLPLPQTHISENFYDVTRPDSKASYRSNTPCSPKYISPRTPSTPQTPAPGQPGKKGGPGLKLMDVEDLVLLEGGSAQNHKTEFGSKIIVIPDGEEVKAWIAGIKYLVIASIGEDAKVRMLLFDLELYKLIGEEVSFVWDSKLIGPFNPIGIKIHTYGNQVKRARSNRILSEVPDFRVTFFMPFPKGETLNFTCRVATKKSIMWNFKGSPEKREYIAPIRDPLPYDIIAILSIEDPNIEDNVLDGIKMCRRPFRLIRKLNNQKKYTWKPSKLDDSRELELGDLRDSLHAIQSNGQLLAIYGRLDKHVMAADLQIERVEPKALYSFTAFMLIKNSFASGKRFIYSNWTGELLITLPPNTILIDLWELEDQLPTVLYLEPELNESASFKLQWAQVDRKLQRITTLTGGLMSKEYVKEFRSTQGRYVIYNREKGEVSLFIPSSDTGLGSSLSTTSSSSRALLPTSTVLVGIAKNVANATMAGPEILVLIENTKLDQAVMYDLRAKEPEHLEAKLNLHEDKALKNSVFLFTGLHVRQFLMGRVYTTEVFVRPPSPLSPRSPKLAPTLHQSSTSSILGGASSSIKSSPGSKMSARFKNVKSKLTNLINKTSSQQRQHEHVLFTDESDSLLSTCIFDAGIVVNNYELIVLTVNTLKAIVIVDAKTLQVLKVVKNPLSSIEISTNIQLHSKGPDSPTVLITTSFLNYTLRINNNAGNELVDLNSFLGSAADRDED